MKLTLKSHVDLKEYTELWSGALTGQSTEITETAPAMHTELGTTLGRKSARQSPVLPSTREIEARGVDVHGHAPLR